jgi:hypothetical protein
MQVIRTIRTIARKIAKAAVEKHGNYYVWDCHGTKIPTWTYAGAEAWLPSCSPRACIVCRNTRTILTVRNQVRAY